MSDILQTAIDLAERGHAVHWLRGKQPVADKWSSQPPATAEALKASYREGYNLGVRPGKWSNIEGKELVILDVDVHGGAQYLPEAEAAMRALIGDLAPTVQTGGGGLHVWFWVEPGKLPEQAVFKLKRGPETGKNKYAWEIELLYSGKQVVAPPSLHPDSGQPYVWLNGGTASIADIPPAVLEAALQPLKPSPRPLQRKLPEPPAYPLECLGQVLGAAALALAENVQCAPAVAAQSVLAAATLAAQPHADMMIDGRVCPLSDFFLTIADSGDRKSSADKVALKPIHDHQKALWDFYGEALKDFELANAAYQSSVKQIINDKKLSREAKANKVDALGPPPPQPVSPEILSQEPTLEGLIKTFLNGQPSRGLFNAEGGQFLGGHGMNQDNILKTIAGLSLFWDGAPITRTRAEAGQNFSLYGRRLSLHLMVQPTVARAMLADPLLHSQGFLSRFLVAYPGSIAGTRIYRPSDPASVPEIVAYWEGLHVLLAKPMPQKLDTAGQPSGELEPPRLTLEADAHVFWVQAYNAIEIRLGEGGELHPVKPLASKAAEHIARLAGVLAVFHDPACQTVAKRWVEGAAGIVSYHLNEGLRLYHVAQEDPQLIRAERLLKWLHEHGKNIVTLPEIYQTSIPELRSAGPARDTLRILESHDWVQPVAGGAEYRGKLSREAWRVNYAD